MVSLSDSFEERMLQAMTKETMEGSPSEDEKPTRNSKLFNYVANDSSDDTTSTPRPTVCIDKQTYIFILNFDKYTNLL